MPSVNERYKSVHPRIEAAKAELAAACQELHDIREERCTHCGGSFGVHPENGGPMPAADDPDYARRSRCWCYRCQRSVAPCRAFMDRPITTDR